jgi:hypothetical protein
VTTTITATAEPSATPPRVKLDIVWTAASSASVTRVDPDGQERAVRLGDPAILTAGAATIYDYESWFGASTVYKATVTGTTVSSSAVSLNVDDVWLRHPGLPTLSLPVELSGDGEPQYALARSKLEPMGRTFPIVVTDGVRKAKSTSLGLRTYDLTERQDLLDLLADGSVLLLDVPPAKGWRFTHQYMALADAVAAPISPSNPHTPWDEWTIPYDVVDRPASGPSAPWDYAAVLTGYATYAAVKADFTNYTNLLANVPV